MGQQNPYRIGYRCLACKDLGVEDYRVADRTHGGMYTDHAADCTCHTCVYKRPCKHCEEGRRTLDAWTRGPSKDGAPGPWYGMDPERMAFIMARPCAHPPLPAVVNRAVPAPADASEVSDTTPLGGGGGMK